METQLPPPATGAAYVIRWENMDGPGIGRSRRKFDLDEANALARQLNASHPKIKHTVEPV